MMKRLATVALMAVASCLSATAAEVRPADEIEMLHHIRGCWELERSAREIEELRNKDATASADICFEGEGKVTMSTVGGSLKYGLEGFEADGDYELTNGKLRLHADGYGDGWFIGGNDVECDVIVRPGVAIKLMNCIGRELNANGSAGTEVRLSDTSYAWHVYGMAND